MKARPYFKRSPYAHSLRPHAAGSGPWTVPELCAAYQWPTGLVGGGVIAIIALGGGWTRTDMTAFFSHLGQPTPSITDVSVDGATNTPGQDVDSEITLDIQIAAASYFAATGHPATIRVYWANDLTPAIRAATKDGCDVCSISWGASEADWEVQAAHEVEAAAQEAVKAGMVIFAASGDNNSSDGGVTAANVDLPAGCPHVIGCGGTTKTRASEVVWNNTPGNAHGDGSGGGFSTVFPMPAWQQNVAPKGPGRMVPDVAANADPTTGYQIYLHGTWQSVGGTSAVAPLYSGLFAAFGKKLGFIADKLWNSPSCFIDIRQGDNGMFHAQPGADPCTGLGAPIGRKIDGLFVAAPCTPTTAPAAGASTAAPVTLIQAIVWAQSLIPNVITTPQVTRSLIETALRKNWPSGMP